MTASCFSNNSSSAVEDIFEWRLWTQSTFLIKYKHLGKISLKKCILEQFEILNMS